MPFSVSRSPVKWGKEILKQTLYSGVLTLNDLLCDVGQRWGSTFYLGRGVMEGRRAFRAEGVGCADHRGQEECGGVACVLA